MSVSILEDADFKSNICFRKLQTQSFGVLGKKKINFLILTKLNLPLFDGSDFNYTFEQKCQNLGLIGQNQTNVG